MSTAFGQTSTAAWPDVGQVWGHPCGGAMIPSNTHMEPRRVNCRVSWGNFSGAGPKFCCICPGRSRCLSGNIVAGSSSSRLQSACVLAMFPARLQVLTRDSRVGERSPRRTNAPWLEVEL